jgi:putative endonuclease
MAHMSNRKKIVGRCGEDAAGKYLTASGYMILTTNFRTRYGEIDIMAKKDDLPVFVEVKTLMLHTVAYPENSKTLRKQAHMHSAAEEGLLGHPGSGVSWQVVVVALEGTPVGKAQIVRFENVFG